MRLSDALRDLGPNLFGEAALLLFLGAFALITWRAFSRKRSAEYERAAQLPLED